jgi:competence protein ComEA
MVYVAGAVVHPGMYAVAPDARAFDAVTRAGGLTRDADAVAVNLAAHVADGDEIAVPRIGDDATKNAAPRSHAGSHKRSRRAKHHRSPRRTAPADEANVAPVAAARIDLNTADATTLATVPGIGPTLAQRIVDFRAVNGRFTTVDGLLDVSGVSASRFDAIASFLTVGPP